MSRSKWLKNAPSGEQLMDDYNQQMAQYMQPTPVQQPQDPYQTQLNFEGE